MQMHAHMKHICTCEHAQYITCTHVPAVCICMHIHTYVNVSTQNTLSRHTSAMDVWTYLCVHSPHRKPTLQFSVVSEASVLHCIRVPSFREKRLRCIRHPYQMPLETVRVSVLVTLHEGM